MPLVTRALERLVHLVYHDPFPVNGLEQRIRPPRLPRPGRKASAGTDAVSKGAVGELRVPLSTEKVEGRHDNVGRADAGYASVKTETLVLRFLCFFVR